MKCEAHGQYDDAPLATVHVTWGLYEIEGKPRDIPMHEADMCEACSRELWQTVRGAVNAGLMHLVNRPVSEAVAA